MFSGRILDAKEKKEKGISYFFNQLDDEICKDVTICVVPSHMERSGVSCGKLSHVRKQMNVIQKF